ncbi:Dehydrin ERD14 [Hirschfeldia incana]|nr:Dehydrin ERD14 [Hirschfeldia incana]
MAEETKNVVHEQDVPKVTTEESSVEVTDRGLFDFMGKKKEETKPEGTIDSEFEQKVHISEPVVPEVKHEEEEKKHSLLEKLHRSDSSSSSSSEEEGEDGVKRKKKKDKKKSTTTTVEGEVKTDEEKKGFMDKLKEKLPGHGKKPEDASSAAPAAPVVAPPVEEAHPAEKKGILEKIKEKLPGYHPKTVDEVKKEKESD